MPPVLHHAPVTTFFSSLLVIYIHFLTKTVLLDAPQGGCPGPLHRSHPTLHATVCVCGFYMDMQYERDNAFPNLKSLPEPYFYKKHCVCIHTPMYT